MDKKRIIILVLIIVFALLFLVVGGIIGFKLLSGANQTEEPIVATTAAQTEAATQGDTVSSSSAEGTTAAALAENPIDFDDLKKTNPDIYSWIKVPNTNIDYPVLQSNLDDEYYLDHDMYKNYSFPGSIFSQLCNLRDYLDRVTVLYGHNMASGAMFADLHKFEDKSFFDENKYFYIYTEDRKLTYEIVSAYVYDDRHIMNSFDFSDDKVFTDFIKDTTSPYSLNSNVRSDVQVGVDDKIVILSTCLNSGDGRYLVQGVLIKDEHTK